MVIGGIFGPKLSGKTTLAIELSQQYWRQCRMRSLVLDPWGHNWGPQAWVTADETKFWQSVNATKGALIIVDEAAATIRRERDLIPAFTGIRHLQHKLIVIGHSGADLLPTMRQQVDELFLFRQPLDAAEIWAKTFTDDSLLGATTLKQFEFIHATLYKGSQRQVLSLGAPVKA